MERKLGKIVHRNNVVVLVLAAALASIIFASVELRGQLAYAHHVTQEIAVGSGPLQMSLANDRLFVANVGERSISIIDASKDKTIGTMKTGGGVSTLYAVPQAGKLYVSIFEQPRLEVYNLTTFGFIRNVTLPGATLDYWYSPLDNFNKHVIMPTGGSSMDYDPSTGMMYVAIYNHDHIEIVDTHVDQAIKKIDLPAHPSSVKVDPQAQMVLVTSTAGGRLSFISTKTNEFIGDLTTGSAPWDLALDTSSHTAYVTHMASHYIAAVSIPTREVTARIPVSGEAQAVAVDSSEHKVYFTTIDGQSINKLNDQTNEVETSIEMDGVPTYLLADSSSHKVYASMNLGNKVVVIGPNAISTTFPVITTDSPSAVVGSISVHGQDVIPSAPTLSIANKTLSMFVESQDGGNLTVVIPRDLIDSQQSSGNSQFQVMIGGKQTIYQEGPPITGQDGSASRVLNIDIPKGTTNMQIMGTQVVPEFGSVVAAISGVALVSVIVIARRTFGTAANR